MVRTKHLEFLPLRTRLEYLIGEKVFIVTVFGSVYYGTLESVTPNVTLSNVKYFRRGKNVLDYRLVSLRRQNVYTALVPDDFKRIDTERAKRVLPKTLFKFLKSLDA